MNVLQKLLLGVKIIVITLSLLGCPAICNSALCTADVGSSDVSVASLSVLDSSANLTDLFSKETIYLTQSLLSFHQLNKKPLWH